MLKIIFLLFNGSVPILIYGTIGHAFSRGVIMSKPKVLITREIPSPGIELLKTECEIEMNTEDRAMTRSELLSRAADKDAVLCLLTDKIDAEFFDAAPRLKGVANYAVGFDNMNVAEASSRGIFLSNTPDVLTEATAEMAWALLFSVSRRIVESDLFLRTGQWAGWGPLQFVGQGISGKTLGIVGPGRIGTSMAMMSRGFNMKVLYSGNRKNDVLEKEMNAELVSFSTLIRESDFISLHVPLRTETKHMFSASVFKEMKKSSVIINTARGAVINEEDLLDALVTGEIAGAGLDVYEFEPEVTEKLKILNNVVLTPHTGSGTIKSRDDMSIMAAENILAMLKNKKPPQCINPEIFQQEKK